MTVKELKSELSKYPDNMDVFMDERYTDFTYGLLNSVCQKEIEFSEDPDSKPWATDTVVILSEQ